MSRNYDSNGEIIELENPSYITFSEMKAADYRRMHTTYVREGRKIGRNEPCPCGSGLKFKKCHMG